MTNFNKFKLGFDRTFWINSANPEHIKVYETALASQEAALLNYARRQSRTSA